MLKKISKRAVLAWLVTAACTSYAAYPEKVIKLIVPFGAGTSTDAMAREFGQALSAVVKQPVVVENKTGAEGTIGGQALIQAPPDGYTIMLTSSSLTVLDPLIKKVLPYDPNKDFTPVCGVARVGNVMNMSSTLPYKNVTEFLAAAKAAPGKFTFAYSSATTRLAGELFSQASGIQMVSVPYRTSAAGLADVAGGQVSLFFIDHLSASPFYQSGKIKPLVVGGPQRNKSLPEVPSASEVGVPGYQIFPWFGVYLSAQTPPAIANVMREAMAQALKVPAMKAKIESSGMEEFPICGDALGKLQVEEMNQWAQVIKKAGIEKQ
ncbi:MAG: hypothetical protein RL300_970 [Pseudomonadota bacterium]|jgi:tripartite-type tricarboxylate transporter receptor subunit TctC